MEKVHFPRAKRAGKNYGWLFRERSERGKKLGVVFPRAKRAVKIFRGSFSASEASGKSTFPAREARGENFYE